MDLIGPVNPVMRDPHDFGSREFCKAANAHAVRRWAEATDEVMRLKALVEWADTIICSSQPDESVAKKEWRTVTRNWRDQANTPNREL